MWRASTRTSGGLADDEGFRRFLARTGAVVMGRRTYDIGNGDDTGYELQMPILVVTSRPAVPPTGANERMTFTLVTEGSRGPSSGRRRRAARTSS